ncbi:serine/threonine protein phosphatase PPT1 [Histomonas meleagridis]|uniref:serine/threonine protein phosphatase PPT1 n=1 Tax=Histomonas meleagridis TaxID=135588 RepID=UPI003559ECDC|nr:serine/threonine protein phosphatase PPT1 [Histomonas meleagridis]KAH0797798.1 serine/threonine protein phosphatase PPT1 [Histomonas meleagridis]
MSGEFPDTIKGELIKGFDAKDDGNYELALEAFTNVINSSDLPASRKPQILSIRSSLYADMGMNYNSYCDACQGLELDPQELQCLSWKSKILENCGNLDESKDVLLELSQISSEKQILYLIKRIDYKKNLLTNCPPLDCEKLINRDIELQSMKLEDVKSFMLDETEGIKCNPKKILEIINGAIVNIGTETKIAKINTPKINIVGGIEGKVGHLTKIFEQNGWPSSENKYLFNGNIIGQNSNSLPLVISLLLFKFIEKDCIFFNQGA